MPRCQGPFSMATNSSQWLPPRAEMPRCLRPFSNVISTAMVHAAYFIRPPRHNSPILLRTMVLAAPRCPPLLLNHNLRSHHLPDFPQIFTSVLLFLRIAILNISPSIPLPPSIATRPAGATVA